MKNSTKNSTRILTAVLSAMLLFSACGKEPATSIASSSDKSSSSEASKTPESLPSSESPEKPVTIRILDKHRLETFYNYDDRTEFESFKAYEDELAKRGIVLKKELVANEQYATVIQTRMAAASDLPDLVNVSPLDDATAVNMGMDGTLLDWLEPMEKYSRRDPLQPTSRNGDPSMSLKERFEKVSPFALSLSTAEDGKMYWCPNARYFEPLTLPDGSKAENLEVVGACIRYDWLKKVNLEPPKTIDEFLNALRAFQKNDVNGNGLKDEKYAIDLYSYSFFSGIAQWFGLTPGVCGIDPNNDKVTSPWYQDGAKDYFKLLSSMISEDLLDITLVGVTEEMLNQAIAEDRVAGLRTYAAQTWFSDLVKTNPDAEYATIAPIEAVKGISPFLLCDSNKMVYNKYAMTKACTPEVQAAIIHFYDFATGTEISSNLCNAGIEGVDFEYVDDTYNPGRKLLKSKLEGVTIEDRYTAKVGGCNFFLHGVSWMSGQDPEISNKIKTKPVQETLDNWTGSEKAKRGYLRKLDQVTHRPYVTSPFSSTTLAIPTAAEQETLGTYLTALQSYSDELGMNLILGNESLDNWDSFIQKFKDLGLDEVIKANEARYQRYKKN